MRWKALALAIIICLACTVHPADAATTAEVAVEAPDYFDPDMASFTVNVTVQPEEPLGGMECGIRFNASVLEAVQVEGGELFDGWWNSSLDIDNDNGTIGQLLGFNYGGNETTEPGVFASVTFTATGEGRGWIRLVNVSLSDPTGNESVPYTVTHDTVIIVDDDAPPELSYSLSPATPDGDNGWYISSVEVSMSAQDDYGVKNVSYLVDNDGWQTISGNTTTFPVSTDGNHTVKLQATELVGKTTDETPFTIEIDGTPPTSTVTLSGTETQPGVYSDSVTVNLSAEDAMSGVNYTHYNLDGTGWKNYTGAFPVTTTGDHTLDFRTVDMGDNTEAYNTRSFEVVNNTAPTANFSYAPSTPSTADALQFTDESSDPDGSITAWEWSFGDGLTATSGIQPIATATTAATPLR